MAELVVSVDTVKAFAPRLLTFIELTETALVHVSALLAPLVRTMPVGTGVKRPLIVILSGDIKNRALRTLFFSSLKSSHPADALPHTPLHWRGYGSAPIFMGILIFMGNDAIFMEPPIFIGYDIDLHGNRCISYELDGGLYVFH
jgi:hypothetical protein